MNFNIISRLARTTGTAAVAAVLLSGCFSLKRGEIGTSGIEHVLVSNYGWKLFHFIPLVCGNAANDPFFPCVFFRNDVTMDKIQNRFMQYANGQGKIAEGLVYTTQESVMIKLPGMDIAIPIPYLVTYQEIQLSGILHKPGVDP